MLEKIYYIHNPLTGAKDWLSERDFQIGSQKMKDVFGVLYLDDVMSMLRYNTHFKESIIKENNISDEKSISIHHVCRLISKAELMDFIDTEVKESNIASSSYPSKVELSDGCFFWNEEKGCYDELVVVN